jgi:hypothetical protein
MGLDVASLKILLRFYKYFNICFRNTLLIGRQNLNINKQDYIRILKQFDFNFSKTDIINSYDIFSERLFHLLGAKTVDSIDNVKGHVIPQGQGQINPPPFC